MSNYWKDRMAASQNTLSNKTTKQVEAQLKKYYAKSMNSVISSFESTYDKLLATMKAEQKPTPADLYKLDKYWKMQGQLRQELEKLGARQATALSKAFETNFFEVYHSINLEGVKKAFTSINTAGARQIINSVWCADGKSWSERVWGNVNKLQQTLNDGLIECVVTGKKTTELKKTLQERFGVSYRQADMITRTEIAHIQTEASKQRYQDYGVEKVQFWADPDERTCDQCGKMHEKIFTVGEHVPLPLHPNCRCTLIPVVDVEVKVEEPKKEVIQETKQQQVEPQAQVLQANQPKQATTIEQAREILTKDLGFAEVENSFNRVEPQLQIEITNQLNTLDARFGAIKASNGTISGGARGNTYAYVQYGTSDPDRQNLVFNTKHTKDITIKQTEKEILSNWSMPCSEENYSIYTTTHEYGHMLQNIMISDELKKRNLYGLNRSDFFTGPQESYNNLQYGLYIENVKKVHKEIEKQCFDEIVAIAKKNNPNFSLKDNICVYGKTNRKEFFAEVFANSQLGKPNELGKAMEEWLKRKGY